MNRRFDIEFSPLPPISTETVSSPGAKYEILTGHRRTDGTYKSGEQLRVEYIHRTDELIRQATQGVPAVDPETHQTFIKKPDDLVFLDKSARPVGWMTRELWPRLAPAPGESVPPMPNMFFSNIDREQWVNTVDPEGKGMVDMDAVSKTVIRSLRSIYVAPQYKTNGLTEDIDKAPASLDGHTVLLVDEVRASGRTLKIAQEFYARAFPTTSIAATHWMGGVAQLGTAQGNADLPVWYKQSTQTGRGVGNRDENRSQQSASLTQRLGGWFLSTRLPEMDPASYRLRREIHQLAHDSEVLVVPSFQREEEDFNRRALALNGLSTFAEFIAAKRQIDAT